MRALGLAGAAALGAVLFAAPVWAQQASPQSSPPSAGAQATPPARTTAPAAPAAGRQPKLVVATVKLTSGRRASKLIGSGVYNEQNQEIGSIDDMIVTPDGKLSYAIISVGGFLGIGGKLVAVPYDRLQYQTEKDHEGRLKLAGATKEALQSMPSFTYGK